MITIVILIILAGIAINLGISENGIFGKAKEAKETTNKQVATEKINLKITTAQINKYAEKQEMPTLKELSVALANDKEIAYVTEVSQIASTKYEVGDSPTSIFTKLKDYNYEFEINSKLQLASINGIKIAKAESNNSWKKYMMNENGYIIGNENVELPTIYTELFIKVELSNGGVSYNFNILYDELKTSLDAFFEGFAISGLNNYARIDIKEKKNLCLTEAFMNGNNAVSTAKVEIWYK